MIWAIGLEGLRSFYNKIPDNVRERTPSVMVYNPNNPSGSPKEIPRRDFIKFGAKFGAMLQH